MLPQAGREDRPKYTHGPRKMNAHASTSNKEKQRGKAYSMVKHKVMNRKKKRSFRDKQVGGSQERILSDD